VKQLLELYYLNAKLTSGLLAHFLRLFCEKNGSFSRLV
jgi:hypothetical protein